MNNWISVEDSLPEPHVEVLLYDRDDDDIWIGILVPEKHCWVSEGFILEYDTFSHWMPLPEPPK